MIQTLAIGQHAVLDVPGLDALFAALAADGYTLWGPRVRDAAIVLDQIAGVADLPRGVGDEQAPGRYRLRARNDDALFGYAASPHSPKRELLVPRTTLLTIRKRGQALEVQQAPAPQRKLALIGVRACELAAMAIQDRVLIAGPHADMDYSARRSQLFVLAVNCSDPAGTCFCVSMQTGPKAQSGFDLAATELLEPSQRFVVEVGSERGAELLARVATSVAQVAELEQAQRVTDHAAAHMGRALDTHGLPELLMQNLEHPRWNSVAERCLGCANCTMVCPTCFCTSTEDTTDLTGELATRSRLWDSCFTADFAYVNGGSARPTLRSRYRQWLTHKLATWHEQFDSSGCVGCGRCVTWCPVGIDITEEAAAIRATADVRSKDLEG
jgi:sulfhydrogenase subunit beta (sulfur reductase)